MNYKIYYNSHISEDLLKYCSLYTAVFSNKKILYKEHYFNFFLLLEQLISRYHFVLIKVSSLNKPPLTQLF
jgi:hypothetical protein